MKILIDDQRVIDIPMAIMNDEEGEAHHILAGDAMADLLEAWRSLSSRRDYRYGDPDGDGPDTIIIAWCTADGALTMEQINPFWTGSQVLMAWSLDQLAEALPAGMLQWEGLE